MVIPTKIECLDHGFVRLIDFMGDDLSVVRVARVSYDAAWRAGENEKSDEKLINYLWKNNHTTPFEAVTFTFEIKAPIFIFRQWHRHRTWSYNELSARYRELPEELYTPEIDKIGIQSENNKQAREQLEKNQLNIEELESQILYYETICKDTFEGYRYLLKCGWPRELARMVLPLSTYSHMFATVNLLNLLKFITLRSHEHAQYEIRVYSDAMKELIKPIVPTVMKAFENEKSS